MSVAAAIRGTGAPAAAGRVLQSRSSQSRESPASIGDYQSMERSEATTNPRIYESMDPQIPELRDIDLERRQLHAVDGKIVEHRAV